jgi:hypothetical protein
MAGWSRADLFRDPCRAQRLARGVLWTGLALLGNSGARARARHFRAVVADLPKAWPTVAAQA